MWGAWGGRRFIYMTMKRLSCSDLDCFCAIAQNSNFVELKGRHQSHICWRFNRLTSRLESLKIRYHKDYHLNFKELECTWGHIHNYSSCRKRHTDGNMDCQVLFHGKLQI
jgi:hypothetical protein